MECFSSSQVVKQSSQLVLAREVGTGEEWRRGEMLSNKSDAPLRPVSRRIILLWPSCLVQV